jgi:hypothetical protein
MEQRQYGKTAKLEAFGDAIERMLDEFIDTLTPNRQIRRTRFIPRSGVTTTPRRQRWERRRRQAAMASESRRANR